MFRFLKRNPTPASKPGERAGSSKSKPSRPDAGPSAPAPALEVIEGNGESDWSLWEESVSFQDSQMSTFGPTTLPLGLPEERSESEAGYVDPFSSVRKKKPR